MGGAVIREMLREQMRVEAAHAEDEPMSEQSRAEACQASRARLARVVELIDADPDLEIPEREQRILQVETAIGEDRPYPAAFILASLLSERAVWIMVEGIADEDEHAAIVETFARATQGAWRPADCRSTVDDRRREFVA